MNGPRIVIVGAGMGGSVLAHFLLLHKLDVTVVVDHAQPVVKDVGLPARLWPHIAGGTGGTTRFWHNGLIEPHASVWSHWPFGRAELLPFMEQVYPLLSGVALAEAQTALAEMKQAHVALGVPENLLADGLFYPQKRRNIWQSLKLDGRVRVVSGRCLPLELPKDGKLQQVRVETERGIVDVKGDIFVMAAGGLGTPPLLQNLNTQAGRHYEDHPTGFLAEVTLREGFYKLWNYRKPKLDATLRQPFVVEGPHGLVAFYLRPAFHLVSQAKRRKVTSVMSDLRNKPFHLPTYLRLLGRMDDVLDIVSFKLGLNVKTTDYTVMIVAEQPAGGHVAVTLDGQTLVRDWRLDKDYLDGMETALGTFLGRMGGLVVRSRLLPDWRETMTSSSHHSGTARMAAQAEDGVCDADGKVFGTENVFVADGSVLPATSYANTGLLIAAVAARLGAHLTKDIKEDKKMMDGMVDFVVTGAGGFIGARMIPLLQARGLTVTDAVTFDRNPGLRAQWVLHLANIHGNPTANAQLTQQLLARYAGRVHGWVVPMTFGSLTGCGKLDVTKVNAGKKPSHFGPYVAGKLLQERLLLRASRAGQTGPLVLPYLPHIADANSPWDLLHRQIQAHGYMAGGTFAQGTGPNLIDLSDLADWLKDTRAMTFPKNAVIRNVLRNPKLGGTWKETLAPYHALPFIWRSGVARVKFLITFCIQLALGVAWRMGLLALATRILWRHKNVPIARRQYEVGQEPAIFEPWDPTFSQPIMGDLSRPIS